MLFPLQKIKKPLFFTQFILLAVSVVVYFVLDYIFDLPPAALEFHSEIVKAEPIGNELRIAGEYHFMAHHWRKNSYELGFPVSEKKGTAPLKNINVVADGSPLPFKVHPQGLSFRLPVKPGGETIMKVSYIIPAPEKKGVYITRTANLWQKAITRAEFIIPEGVRSNYHEPGKTSAVFTNFRPKENWIISWR